MAFKFKEIKPEQISHQTAEIMHLANPLFQTKFAPQKLPFW